MLGWFSNVLEIEKASILKRVSAWLLDIIIALIIATGFGWTLSSAFNLPEHVENLQASYAFYENKYSVTFDITYDEYMALGEKALDYDKAYAELTNDLGAMKEYNLVLNYSLITATFAILIAVLVTEFVMPLIFKNGMTVGKKIFGIAVIRTNGVKASNITIFVRALFGKYTIETMFPAYIILMISFDILGSVGLIILALLAVLQLILVAATHNNYLIHDLLSDTVSVDFASQLIFDSQEALLEAKEKAHAERVKREIY